MCYKLRILRSTHIFLSQHLPFERILQKCDELTLMTETNATKVLTIYKKSFKFQENIE